MMSSDNATDADNQQERLIQLGWVVGFVDGEGCFSIGFVRQPNRANRRGYTIGYQVSHDFVVTQGARSVGCLHELRDFFGVGNVYQNARFDNHKEDLFNFYVVRQRDLMDVVIPFFRENPLHSAKQEDFEKFARCVELMETKSHLTHKGLIEIVEIAETMNRRKPRSELIRILRDFTPDT